MDESLREAGGLVDEAWPRADARRVLASARRVAAARWAEALCAVVLLVMSLSLLAATARKTVTIDEVVLIPAAYYHFVAGDFHLVHEHPPLCKIVAGLPLLFVQPNEIPRESVDGAADAGARKWVYQDHFWTSNRAQFERVAYWPRAAMCALTVALGVLVFAFARELFGPRAAVLAVLLYSIEPTVLAHGRVVQTDVPAAFGYLAVCYALYRYLRAPSWRRAAVLGAACGAALLSKFSMLVVAPVLFVVFLVLLWRARREGEEGRLPALFLHAAATIIVTLLVVHAAYYFHSRALSDEDLRWIASSFPSSAAAVERAVRALSYLLPTDFVLGVFWQLWHGGEGHAAGLLGMYRQTGWWYYFPVAFALKTTLPFLLLSLAALAWGCHRLIRKRDARLLILLVPFAVYTAFVLMSPINIGVRYYLPAYTSLFVAGGALLDALLRRRGRAGLIGAAAAVALVGWMAFEAVRAYPDYMAYMNQLASSRPHYWYLSDSNVEWGDDVKQLAAYLRARGETRVRAAVLGGFLTLPFHGVEQVDLLTPPAGEPPRTRYTAVGASFLNGSTVPVREVNGVALTEEQRVNYFDEYRRRAPEKIFGGSIYLFREYE